MKNDWKIEVLRGPDRIRKRPAVVFGDTGREGATEAARMILNVFLIEAQLGFCEKISFKLVSEDTVLIESRDRGFLLDETELDGKPSWYYDFCDFGVPPREASDEYMYTVGRKYGAFYGLPEEELPAFKSKGDPAFQLCCVQYASEWMKVESVHDNLWKRISFEKGYPVGQTEKRAVSEPSYTRFSYKLDPEVFSDVSVSFYDVAKFMRESTSFLKGFVYSCSEEDRTIDLVRTEENA